MNTVQGNGFEIHFRWNGDVLVAQVEGPCDSYDVSLAYWKVIASERVRVGAERVLVLEHLKGTGDEDEVLELAAALLELDFVGTKVAFVDDVDYHRSIQEHIAIQARERGILAAIFSDAQQALTWLRHGEEE